MSTATSQELVPLSAAHQDDLAQIARELNSAHFKVQQAMLATLEHAIMAGELLLRARALLPNYGTWYPWLAENFDGSASVASTYMRVAHYKEIVRARPWAANDNPLQKHGKRSELMRAQLYLRGLPPAVDHPRRQYSDEIKAEARRLVKEEGISGRVVAELLGVCQRSVSNWVNPHQYRRNHATAKKRAQERRAARLLEKQAQREQAIKKIRGPGSEAYALLRRAALLLDQAASEADPVSRPFFNAALRRLYGVEDEVAKALKVETTSGPPIRRRPSYAEETKRSPR